MSAGLSRDEQRLLLLAPTGKDAALTAAVLAQVGIACDAFRNLDALTQSLARGAGAVMLPEEALPAIADDNPLLHFVARQPAWSDLPILLLTRTGADSSVVDQATRNLTNVSLLERPIRMAALVSAVHAALRARRRQYQIRAQILELRRYADSLRVKESQLREADRRKDEFLATLAHELRNPLAPIRNALEVMRLGGATGPLREMMERQVGHMVRLIDDLLELSRITRGKIELRRAPVALGDVILNALETSRPLIEGARQLLEVDLPAEPVMVHGDAVRLAQVFANLFNNAAKYTGDGGTIAVTARVEGAQAVVAVRDTGVGIPPAMLGRIFDMFTQVGDPQDRAKGGLGIGLTLVRTLVEMHGGSVRAYSEGPGRGAEFRVRLPLLVAHPAETRPAPRAALPGLAHRRVLVADDNRDAATSLCALLELLGLEARAVFGGEDAIRALADFPADLVLMDLGMPGVSGYEAARSIRANPATENVRLVALTGWGQHRDRERSHSAGFDEHLVKPVSMDALAALVAAAPDRGVRPAQRVDHARDQPSPA